MAALSTRNLHGGRRACAAVALVCALLAAPLASRAEGTAADVLSAVVGVRAVVPATARTAESLGTVREGSGVLIDAEGFILTIGFLIMEAEQAEVIDTDGQAVPAEIAAYDWESGIGLLRARQSLAGKPIPLGDARGLKPEDRVLVVAHDGPSAVTPAFVVDRRDFPGYWEYLLENAIFTAPLNPRHPGAALVGPEGTLLGIGYLALGDVTESGRVNPGNMFVPIDRIKPIMADLKRHGHSAGPAKPWLGLYAAEAGGRVFVTRVSPDGPSERAGIEPGAIVLSVAGKKVDGHADFYRKVWALGQAGVDVPLTLLEGTDIREVTVQSRDRYRWLRLKHSN